MLLLLLGVPGSGKSHFLRQLQGIFFDYHGHDDLTVQNLIERKYEFQRDVGSGELVVVTLANGTEYEDVFRYAADFRQTHEVTVIAVADHSRYLPKQRF